MGPGGYYGHYLGHYLSGTASPPHLPGPHFNRLCHTNPCTGQKYPFSGQNHPWVGVVMLLKWGFAMYAEVGMGGLVCRP